MAGQTDKREPDAASVSDRSSLSEGRPRRCPKKAGCVIAWPEKCRAWDAWSCPVDQGQEHPAFAGMVGVLEEIAVDVVLVDGLDEGGQIVALWGVVRRHTAIAKAALDA